MKANFQRSLLKGVHEVPIENIGAMREDAFYELSLIEKFLITDTLLTYSSIPETYPKEIEEAPIEEFPFSQLSIAKLFKNFKKSLIGYVTRFVINAHIGKRKLLHPNLILEVFANKNAWQEHFTLLPKVMRKRARWLSDMKTDWNWWNEVLRQETWDQKTNELRYSYFSIMRTYKTPEANALLLVSWESERQDSKKIIIKTLTETHESSDFSALIQLFNSEKSVLKDQIRSLLFLSEESEEFIALRNLVLTTGGNIDNIKRIALDKETELKALFLDQKSKLLPTEIFYTMPFDYFTGSIELKSKFQEYVNELKQKGNFLCELLINYIYKHDVKSICLLVDMQMEQGEGFVMSESFLKIFSKQQNEFINELLAEISVNCNSISRWRFYWQIIRFGEISLDKKNTSGLITLTTLYLKGSNYSKSLISEFLARACFCVHSSYLGDWSTLCEDLIRKNPDLKKMKLDEMIEELITFRQQIEANI